MSSSVNYTETGRHKAALPKPLACNTLTANPEPLLPKMSVLDPDSRKDDREERQFLDYEIGKRVIAFHRIFVDICGDVPTALFLSQAMYWSRHTTLRGRWFYKSAGEWEDETGLSRRQQERSRKVLIERGILEVSLRGRVPATIHFRINIEALKKAEKLLSGARKKVTKS